MERAALEARLKGPPVQLMSHVSQVGSGLGVEVTDLRPTGAPVELDGVMEESVEVNLVRIELGRLARLIQGLERGPGLVKVRRLRIATRGRRPQAGGRHGAGGHLPAEGLSPRDAPCRRSTGATWRPRLLYGALLPAWRWCWSLRWTFPSGAVLERLSVEAAARGWQLEAAEAGAGRAHRAVAARGDAQGQGRAHHPARPDRPDPAALAAPHREAAGGGGCLALRRAGARRLRPGGRAAGVPGRAGAGSTWPARCRCGWRPGST